MQLQQRLFLEALAAAPQTMALVLWLQPAIVAAGLVPLLLSPTTTQVQQTRYLLHRLRSCLPLRAAALPRSPLQAGAALEV